MWILPQFPTKNSHNFISFIDLIKGVVPTKLLSFLTSLEITRPQAVSITTKLLSYIRAASWDNIWIPRCAQFQDFIRSKGITPAQQRSGPRLVSHAISVPALLPIVPLRTGFHNHTRLWLPITYLTAKVILFLDAITVLSSWWVCLGHVFVALAIEDS